jgi:hypothetical protein
MIRVTSATFSVVYDQLMLHLADGSKRTVYASVATITADGQPVHIEDAPDWLIDHGPADATIAEDSRGYVTAVDFTVPATGATP